METIRRAVSDWHWGDPDLDRYVVDVSGSRCSGRQLMNRYAALAVANDWHTLGVGDMYDYCGKLSEAMRDYAEIIMMLRKAGLTIIPGNHDWRNKGAKPADTQGTDSKQQRQDEVYAARKGDLIIPGGIAAEDVLVEGYSYLCMHWHQFDPVWSNPGWLRARLGECLLKNGRALETGVHPMMDEWILGTLKAPLKLIQKRGNRIEDQHYLDHAVKVARAMRVDVMIGGHTHRIGWWKYKGIEIVNLGSAVPMKVRGSSKEIIRMGIWEFERRRLVEMTMNGLRPVKRVHLDS